MSHKLLFDFCSIAKKRQAYSHKYGEDEYQKHIVDDLTRVQRPGELHVEHRLYLFNTVDILEHVSAGSL